MNFEYLIMHKGKVARKQHLYSRSLTAAKQMLSQKLPKLFHIYPAGKWKTTPSSIFRTFTTQSVDSNKNYTVIIKPIGIQVDNNPQLTLF